MAKNERQYTSHEWERNFNIMHLLIKSGPKVIKLFSCLTQQRTNFILLISVKMSMIVGILIHISRINTTSECFKARKIFIFSIYIFISSLNFMLSSN